MSGCQQIRSATPEDIPRLREIAQSSSEAPHWTEAQYREMLAGIQESSASRALLLLETDVRIAGFVVMSAAAGQAELESVVVATEFRRRGLGQELCRAALEWAQQHGTKEVWLELRESNAPAQRLYESLGFREAGRRRAYYRDPEEAAVVMRGILTVATHI